MKNERILVTTVEKLPCTCIKCKKKMNIDDVVYTFIDVNAFPQELFRCPRCAQDFIAKEEENDRPRTYR